MHYKIQERLAKKTVDSPKTIALLAKASGKGYFYSNLKVALKDVYWTLSFIIFFPNQSQLCLMLMGGEIDQTKYSFSDYK
jgi:hypothetical protein